MNQLSLARLVRDLIDFDAALAAAKFRPRWRAPHCATRLAGQDVGDAAAQKSTALGPPAMTPVPVAAASVSTRPAPCWPAPCGERQIHLNSLRTASEPPVVPSLALAVAHRHEGVEARASLDHLRGLMTPGRGRRPRRGRPARRGPGRPARVLAPASGCGGFGGRIRLRRDRVGRSRCRTPIRLRGMACARPRWTHKPWPTGLPPPAATFRAVHRYASVPSAPRRAASRPQGRRLMSKSGTQQPGAALCPATFHLREGDIPLSVASLLGSCLAGLLLLDDECPCPPVGRTERSSA